MLAGLILAFVATIFQSTSYIFSRSFLIKHKRGPFALLIISQCVMGIVSLFILPFCLPKNQQMLLVLLPYILFAILAYIFGQFCFFNALKHTEASKVSGMLGFKIVFLALISILFMNQHFSLLQWGAVLMAVIATLIFASSDKLDLNFKENLPVMGWVIATCLGYASCDIISAAGIRLLMQEASPIRATLFVVGSEYMILGIASVYSLPQILKDDRALLKDAIVYSLTWYTGVLFLFLSFAFINVVLANIIQSTRGLTSIGIALIVTKLGHTHLESKMTTSTLVKRTAVAFLMAFSVIFYVLGK